MSAVHLFTHKKAFWHKYPLVEFLFWLAVLLLAGLLIWLGREGELGPVVDSVFLPFHFLLLPLWLIFGLSVVDLAVEVARWLTRALRSLFPHSVMEGLTIFVLLARLTVPWVLLMLNPGLLELTRRPDMELEDILLPAAIYSDMVLSYPLILVALILALSRRWNALRSTKLLALSLTTPVFSLGMILAMTGKGDISNALEFTLSSLGLLPAVIVFVVMLTYNVLGLGAKFARGDGKLLPRGARVLLMLGLAMLVTSLATYQVNLLEMESGLPWNNFVDNFSNLFMLSVIFLGLPYLAWIVWKRPERLVGKMEAFEAVQPRFNGLAKMNKKVWIVAAVVLAASLCCLAFLGTMAMLSATLPAGWWQNPDIVLPGW